VRRLQLLLQLLLLLVQLPSAGERQRRVPLQLMQQKEPRQRSS
jgi:hypothetical protein